MSFPRYPKYKKSNTPWIDIVPKSWGVIQAKRGIEVLTDFTANGSFASLADNVEYKSSGYARLIRMTDLRHQLEREGVWVDEEAYRYLRKSALYGGELLMASVGSVGLVYLMPTVKYPATLAPNMYLLKTNRWIYERYFYWFLLSVGGQDQISQAATVTAQPKLNKDNVRSLVLPLPSEAEQSKVAAFLDYETARIDALVEQQQRLIELLKEKRQVVISHAVTKGLDPDVAMKDSGVEWLGEVPAHWEIKPLRYLGECQNGINIGAEAFGSGFPFVSYGDVYKNEVLPTNPKGLVQSSAQDREKYSIKKGDVLFTRTSETVEEIGFSSTCFQDIPSATFAGFLIRFRPVEEVLSPNFSRYFFGNQRLREFFVKEMEIVTRASLGQDLLKRMSVPTPPVEEQIRIAQYLDAKTQKNDSLLDQAHAAIKLLAERRSALISVAVTGKIDVRGWQPPAGPSAATEATQMEAV
ncbi:restriction endonuclease subunit S [Halomonas sp. BC04]|uniref:restriction endonuclease subunit S n=1 Tax=Halomonas sp. BC04 TaxID=1403540 RepID=UPI0003ED779A|nr:restriction endonuclease subunit S [Halomonas sp. BC04]EWG99942.1 hypothetical protein Q427_22300 [Halomonas sp. BC04]